MAVLAVVAAAVQRAFLARFITIELVAHIFPGTNAVVVTESRSLF
jgi:hypothetical protein